MHSAKITQEDISRQNRVKILGMLWEKGCVTKHDLSSALHLSHTTVNAYIQSLQGEGLVEIVGMGESIGGRRPVVVGLVKGARHFFGVNLAPGRVKILTVNLLGEETARRELPRADGEAFEETLNRAGQSIREMIAAEQLDRRRIMGVGMTFPGVVNRARGRVEYAPNLGIRDYCLDGFAAELGLPLHVENEAVAAAAAEQMLGIAGRAENMVYVSVAEGIGAGIIIERGVYKSNNQRAGEFGHIGVVEGGLPCNCGRAGCWELYASKPALLRYYHEAGGGAPQEEAAALQELAAAFRRGEPAARRALEQYARYLFRGIENILLTLSPDEVVVGGDLGELMPAVIRMGTDELELNKRFFGYEHVPIRASGFRENGAVIGSALLPLDELYHFRRAL